MKWDSTLMYKTDWFHMSLLINNVVFPKSEHDQRVIYIKIFLLYIEYDDFWHNLETFWFLSLM